MADDLVERLRACHISRRIPGTFMSETVPEPLSHEAASRIESLERQREADSARIAELEGALEKIGSNAPMKEPSAEPTVGPPPGWREEMSDCVYEIVQQAFNEGHTRACWEAGQIADAATAERAS